MPGASLLSSLLSARSRDDWRVAADNTIRRFPWSGQESGITGHQWTSLGETHDIFEGTGADPAARHQPGRRVDRGGLVADTEVVQVAGRDVLLVDRFDRRPDGSRRSFVSALTILGLHEMAGRHATYHDLADVVRRRFVRRRATLRELFARIVFNIIIGNTDDHARNHAAFWDGERLELTPAYDICPQARAGGEQAQAMAIDPDGGRSSQFTTCLGAANHYDLTEAEARLIIDDQIRVVTDRWDEVADDVGLTGPERRELWGNQVLNPFASYGYPLDG